MTYREQFDNAMKCTNKEEAAIWLEKEIARYESDYGKTREEASKVILSNLGYMAGYYDQATSKKVHDLFGANHPVFGGPDYWDRVTPEEAFEAGKKMMARSEGEK